MNREEVIDLAMDIFENTDATLEEAMGVAMENQMSKMKAEARKTGDWDKVITRQGLKDAGKNQDAERAYFADERAWKSRFKNRRVNKLMSKYDNKQIDKSNVPERFEGESKTKQYQERVAAEQRKYAANRRNFYNAVGNYAGSVAGYPLLDWDRADKRKKRMGDYSKSVPANNGRGTQYRPKASKEAAIMDTALDFLDMYDVSLEEAIDMAYDYLID